MKNKIRYVIFSLLPLLVFTAAGFTQEQDTVRIGYFPNLTHAQALVARENGFFDSRMEPSVKVEWQVFNAGPSVIEAVFADHLDIAYVGPSPAINGYVKSEGAALRVLAGAASGGAALVVRSDAGISEIKDFHGKKIASPQLGNTQDVALRSWLASQKLTLKDKGGDVEVLPLANADQLSLFQKKELDASWSVEPWVSIYRKKADVKIFLDEASLWPDGKYATTLVIVRKKFLDRNPELTAKFLAAHRQITDWIIQNPEEAKKLVNQGFERVTHKTIDAEILDQAWKRVTFTTDPMQASVQGQASAAHKVGFLKKEPVLAELVAKT